MQRNEPSQIQEDNSPHEVCPRKDRAESLSDADFSALLRDNSKCSSEAEADRADGGAPHESTGHEMHAEINCPREAAGACRLLVVPTLLLLTALLTRLDTRPPGRYYEELFRIKQPRRGVTLQLPYIPTA